MSTSSVSFPPQDLSFLWLEITAKCNLECLHCYADSGPQRHLLGEMNTGEWLQVIAECSDLGCRQIQFIGGEPTLHPNLSQMISFASLHGYTFVEVFTNATNVDSGLMRTLIDHQTHVAISFYSDDPETHDRITKRRGSFWRTVENVRRMLKAGVPARAGIIEMCENAGH